MAKILVNDGMSADGAQILIDAGHELTMDKVPQENLSAELNNFDAIFVRSATKVRQENIDAAPNLKLIGRGGVGLDNIDVDYAKSKGIEIVNTPAASSDSVAEMVLGHMFAVSRWIFISNVTMRNGEWNKKAYKGVELAGKTLGVVGFGRIGQSLAKKATALGMKVIGYDVIDVETDFEFSKDLDSVLPQCDYISLHVPSLGKPLVDAEFIAKMKDGAFLINCARGGVVDEKALVDALNSEKLWGAGVDVFEVEPATNMDLINHPKVSVTPHIGGATTEAQSRIGTELATKVKNFFDGKGAVM
ncbi:MAG: D-2-hydroxyacid dehydrogenase [Candidatus Electryonea clarkiae]|nr:D-2-hydroxyacid dehydrogenase [Candidatus Electryonea clarkiae]MDP8285811.1 D-2-hydroxyacid dehydrogenase [Candidatus Electryonea clarkiae]